MSISNNLIDDEIPTWVAKGRIPSIDGLRAVAIAFVMFAHTSHILGFPELVSRAAGSLGVDIFFVISGFLITTLLLRESNSGCRISLLNFYLRRMIRILPAYFFYVAFIAIWSIVSQITISPKDWIATITFTMNFRDDPNWVVGHLWSLSIEEHFYLCWPVLMAWAPRKFAFYFLTASLLLQPLARWSVLLFAPSLSGMTDVWTFTRFDSIAAGSLMALMASERRWTSSLNKASSLWPLIFTSLIIGLIGAALSGKIAVGITPSITAICLAVLVWAAVRHKPKFFENKLVYSFGIGSYSLYLWQQFFLNKNLVNWHTCFPQNIILSIVAAAISYFFVEKQFLKFKSRYSSVNPTI